MRRRNSKSVDLDPHLRCSVSRPNLTALPGHPQCLRAISYAVFCLNKKQNATNPNLMSSRLLRLRMGHSFTSLPALLAVSQIPAETLHQGTHGLHTTRPSPQASTDNTHRH